MLNTISGINHVDSISSYTINWFIFWNAKPLIIGVNDAQLLTNDNRPRVYWVVAWVEVEFVT